MRRPLGFVLLLLASCAGADESGAPVVSTPDARDDADASAPEDAMVDDAVPADAKDATDATDADDASDAVADGDASPSLHGQCFSDAQCGAGETCAVEAPGGICNGCNVAADCPTAGASYACTVYGACARTCSSDADCARGMECKLSGICGLKACALGSDCPTGTECRALTGGTSTYCQRFAGCTATSCPAGYTCKSTGKSAPATVCVEDALSFTP